MTYKQQERQYQRDTHGRYKLMNPCNGCGKSAGVDYFSHPMTDEPGWYDTAICLCKKCFNATEHMTRVNNFIDFARLNGGLPVVSPLDLPVGPGK